MTVYYVNAYKERVQGETMAAAVEYDTACKDEITMSSYKAKQANGERNAPSLSPCCAPSYGYSNVYG